MEFLKKFFDDESMKVGLCSFKSLKPKYNTAPIEQDLFFNPLKTEKIYETNLSQNAFLIY